MLCFPVVNHCHLVDMVSASLPLIHEVGEVGEDSLSSFTMICILTLTDIIFGDGKDFLEVRA